MFRVMRAIAAGILAVGLAVSASVGAETLPSLDKIMTPKEKLLFADTVQRQLQVSQPRNGPQISVLDAMLAKDPEPTPFRGFLQLLRSEYLLNANHMTEAMAAIDESVRLLPSYSAPLMQAFNVYVFSDRPGDAADFLLRASEIDPEAVKSVDDYNLGSLMYRLQTKRDYKRQGAVAAKLLEIGWSGKQIDGRSKLAAYAIRRRIEDGDIAGARALVPELLLPEKTYALLSDNRFRELWPALETWAGPNLERQWPIYLNEARARYTASGDQTHIIAYIAALESAGDDDSLISVALPLFKRELDPVEDEDLIFVTISLSDALSRAGRWEDLHDMFQRAERVWPLDSQPNALNLYANEARLLLYEDRPAQSVQLMDRAIEKAKAWGIAVNPDANAMMHLYRACALHRLGRDVDAAPSTAIAMSLASLNSIVTLNLCTGNEAGARNALIAGLAREESRSDAIAIFQPPSHAPCKSKYCSDLEELWTKLRLDPQALSELRKYGRVLPFRVNEMAGYGTKPTPRTPSSDAVTALIRSNHSTAS